MEIWNFKIATTIKPIKKGLIVVFLISECKEEKFMYDFTIIGGGIIGAFVARGLLKILPKLWIKVDSMLDKLKFKS